MLIHVLVDNKIPAVVTE